MLQICKKNNGPTIGTLIPIAFWSRVENVWDSWKKFCWCNIIYNLNLLVRQIFKLYSFIKKDNCLNFCCIFINIQTICSTLIKLKIINEFVQIERPKHLSKSKIYTLVNQLINTEKFIAIKNQKLEKFKERWKPFF
jgi:hypothetical protein